MGQNFSARPDPFLGPNGLAHGPWPILIALLETHDQYNFCFIFCYHQNQSFGSTKGVVLSLQYHEVSLLLVFLVNDKLENMFHSPYITLIKGLSQNFIIIFEQVSNGIKNCNIAYQINSFLFFYFGLAKGGLDLKNKAWMWRFQRKIIQIE